MANTSIRNAFERMWQHTVAALNAKNITYDDTNTALGVDSVQEAIEYLSENGGSGSGSSFKDVAVQLLLENWVLDESTNTYSQTVDVVGLKENSNPIIVINPADDVATEEELNDFNCLTSDVTVDNGFITFVAKTLPSASFSVLIKGAIGGGNGGSSADVTELENRVEEQGIKIAENTTAIAENAEAITELNSNLESLDTKFGGYLYDFKTELESADAALDTKFGGYVEDLQTQLNGKANSSHGNHVPTTQTASNKVFLRNDNTWQTITPANIGAAASSHGNHVPATQTANNATFLRNDNTWQKVTPANIGALATGGGTVTGTLVLSKTTDLSGTENKSPALIVGGAATAAHIEFDSNEIQAKTDGTNPGELNLNLDGGYVNIGDKANSYSTTVRNDLVCNNRLSVKGDILTDEIWSYDADTLTINSTYIELTSDASTIGMYSSTFRPTSEYTNGVALGKSGAIWKQLFAGTTTISTSDRNAKDNITPLTDIHKQLFMKLIPVSFTFKDGESGRTHIGFISQDVEQAMKELGMTSLDFAGFCRDVKTKTEITYKDKLDRDGNPVLDEDGNVKQVAVETEVPDLDENGNEQYIYSLRYSEFIGIIAHVLQDSVNRLDSIEERLAKAGL